MLNIQVKTLLIIKCSTYNCGQLRGRQFAESPWAQGSTQACIQNRPLESIEELANTKHWRNVLLSISPCNWLVSEQYCKPDLQCDTHG